LFRRCGDGAGGGAYAPPAVLSRLFVCVEVAGESPRHGGVQAAASSVEGVVRRAVTAAASRGSAK
jgi:hypothetical protein